MIELSKYINFNSPEWRAIKLWLEETKEIKIEMLIGTSDHDKSNQIRGALSMIQALLKLEEIAAQGAANQR